MSHVRPEVLQPNVQLELGSVGSATAAHHAWFEGRTGRLPRFSGYQTRETGPSCTEFVYSECWHFDNDATSKIDDVLTEHGGLLLALPLAVHLRFFCWISRGWTTLSKFYSFGFVVGPLLHA